MGATHNVNESAEWSAGTKESYRYQNIACIQILKHKNGYRVGQK